MKIEHEHVHVSDRQNVGMNVVLIKPEIFNALQVVIDVIQGYEDAMSDQDLHILMKAYRNLKHVCGEPTEWEGIF